MIGDNKLPQFPLLFLMQVFMCNKAIGNHKLHMFQRHIFFFVKNMFHTLAVPNQIVLSSFQHEHGDGVNASILKV